MKNKKVLLGLSGGVDSSVSALLLKKKGFQVIGAFMKNFSDTKNPLTQECSYLEDKKMAQKVCIQLKIPFVFIDSEKEYKKSVIEPMFKSYKSGLTPNPDISCNSIIKFPILRKYAKKLGCDYIATGHYARIKKDSLGFHLLKAKDSKKDQTYFLASLNQEDLKNTLFPIGNLKKEQVRQIAKKNKLPNWNKHGTSGICFVGNVNMLQFLKTRIPIKQGLVKNPEGEKIGTHSGISFYTIGQKALESKGIKINKGNLAQKRFYIADKEKPNTLIVAPENHPMLKRKSVLIKSMHLINNNRKPTKEIKARIRHLGQLQSGFLTNQNSKNKFTFTKPQEGLAEGQYLVLYKNQEVIGSGEIKF